MLATALPRLSGGCIFQGSGKYLELPGNTGKYQEIGNRCAHNCGWQILWPGVCSKANYPQITVLRVIVYYTRQVPVQRAVERDKIPYPYKVHDTTLRPLLNITIKSTIVVRSRSRSCSGGDICGNIGRM